MSEFVLWTPLFSFVIFILFFAIGDWISNLTDSKVSGLLIAMLLYLVGFQTGVIPASSIDDTGLTALASNFAIMLILVGMGMPVSILKRENIFEKVISIKYDVPNDHLEMMDDYMKAIDDFYNTVMEKNG